MLQRYLPVELTDAIIDYLHADHIALAACSLVCRAWRGAAQHHLLAIIHCVGDELEQLLTQIEAQDGSSRVEDDRSCIENSGSQFVDGERVSGVADEKGISASFATHVRELYVCGPQPVRPSFRLPQFNIRIATMARVLREFPNLHTLHLKRLILKPSNTAQARDGQGAEGLETRRRYRLRWLDLRTVYLTNTETLSEMLGLCAEVRDLTLNSVSFWNGGFAEEEEEAERTRGESLGINGQSPAAFEMQGMLRVDGLKTCEVKFPLPECVPMVLEMLGGAAASLENLTLHLFSTDDIPLWKPLDAIPWAKLTHLSLVFKNWERHDTFEPTTLVPIALLLSYLPQTIPSIKLVFDVPSWGFKTENLGWSGLGGLRVVGWNGLETQLMRFTRMESLIIRPHPDEPYREGGFLDTARRTMPQLAARGLLSEAGHPLAQTT